MAVPVWPAHRSHSASIFFITNLDKKTNFFAAPMSLDTDIQGCVAVNIANPVKRSIPLLQKLKRTGGVRADAHPSKEIFNTFLT